MSDRFRVYSSTNGNEAYEGSYESERAAIDEANKIGGSKRAHEASVWRGRDIVYKVDRFGKITAIVLGGLLGAAAFFKGARGRS